MDDQIFEKNLCEKRINGNKCSIKSLELSNNKLQETINLLNKEKRNYILEIEGYKNTIEGNTIKLLGITQELNKKNTIISNLVIEKDNYSILSKNKDITIKEEYNMQNNDEYDIVSSDELL